MSLGINRLQEERKQWRKDHPFGFTAKPIKLQDGGGLDLRNWKLTIPGKEGTKWEGGYFPLTATFPEEYPTKPPKIRFDPGFYHPNVYPSGTICLSILNEEEDWRPTFTMKQLVLGIQELLDTPNLSSPAQQEAYSEFSKNKDLYDRKVKEQVRKYAPPPI